jgi:hypothetical protein
MAAVTASLIAATYFHFLLGGFWSAAVFALCLCQRVRFSAVAKHFGVYGLAVAPLFVLLVLDRLVPVPDYAEQISLTANQIYTNFRAPHHTAPFLQGAYGNTKGFGWLGLVSAIATSAGLACVTRFNPKRKTLAAWLLALHAYLFLALLIAWFDRHTQHLGILYLFRPTTLILLLTALVFLTVFCDWAAKLWKFATYLLVLVPIGLTWWWTAVAQRDFAVLPLPESRMDQSEKEILSWIRANSTPAQVFLFEEGGRTRLNAVNFEYLSERPSLVQRQSLPNAPAEIFQWYHLLELKRAAFEGDCVVLARLPVRYLITFAKEPPLKEAICVRQVLAVGDYRIFEK